MGGLFVNYAIISLEKTFEIKMLLVTSYLNEVSQSAQSFNWHNPSWDLFIILFWAAVSLIYAFAAGRGRVINMLFSLYIAKLMVTQAPWLTGAVSQKLPSQFASLQMLVSFVIIFIVLFILLGRYAFRTSADGLNMLRICLTSSSHSIPCRFRML